MAGFNLLCLRTCALRVKVGAGQLPGRGRIQTLPGVQCEGWIQHDVGHRNALRPAADRLRGCGGAGYGSADAPALQGFYDNQQFHDGYYGGGQHLRLKAASSAMAGKPCSPIRVNLETGR